MQRAYNTPDGKFKLKRLRSDPSKVASQVQEFVQDIASAISQTIMLNFM